MNLAFKGKKVYLIGAGSSGLAAAEWLIDKGAEVLMNEAKSFDALGERTRSALTELEERGLALSLGAPPDPVGWGADLVIASPGVPLSLPGVAEALERGIPVTNEIELGWQACGADVVGITGSNGKTTVTSLVGQIMRDAGFDPFVGGNIGTPFITAANELKPGDWAALELSSFQLAGILTLAPKVAIILNITPDHLDWHKTYEHYARSKWNIAKYQTSRDWLILNRDDPALREEGELRERALKARTIEGPRILWFSKSEPEAEDAAFEAGESARAAGETGQTAGATEQAAGVTEPGAGEAKQTTVVTEQTAGVTERASGESERAASETSPGAGVAKQVTVVTERVAGETDSGAVFVDTDGWAVYRGAYEYPESGAYKEDTAEGSEVVRLMPVNEFKLPGAHNLENLLAALAAGVALGIAPEKLRQSAAAFTALPHRMEPVTEKAGVLYVNDSKATNPDSAIKALNSYDRPIVLIAGGDAKGVSFDEVAELIIKKVKAVTLIGKDRDMIRDTLLSKGFDRISYADGIEQAAALCYEVAAPGDIVLLSPACSSLDMHSSYEERGNRFKEAVKRLTDDIQE